MEYIRVEVRLITSNDFPPVVLPKVSGHRRIYVYTENDVRYLLNIMAIGSQVDGVSYGEADYRMSVETPEAYFRDLTPEFMRVAFERGVKHAPVAFLAQIDPIYPDIVEIIPA